MGTGDDPYDGFDRFGRVVDSRWYDYGSSTDVDRILYGYDRASNRTYREQTCDTNSYHDEVYGYDGVNRLTDIDRGTINGGKDAISTLKFAQEWSLDATGNWSGFKEDDNGDSSWDLDQSRTSNEVNEITNITETSGPAWVTPAYNRAGNMTTIPKPADPTSSFAATYDAWNRLVKLEDAEDIVAEYVYDGAKRRVVKRTYDSGQLDETRHYYCTDPQKWQVMEERLESGGAISANANRQFVWGSRYIDGLVLRDRDTNANGTLDERLFVLQDANWNVTALADSNGDVQERYAYSAYGKLGVLTPTFTTRASSSYNIEVLYAGYRYEQATALFHIRHRVYQPELGCWVQRDPLSYSAGEASLLLYLGDNPSGRTDPFGMRAWCQGASVDVGGFLMHPSGAVKVCWDDCGNLAVAATVLSLFRIRGQETFVPGVLSTFAGLSAQVFGEAALTKHSCVQDMSGIFLEAHLFGGEGIVGEGGIEVTPGIHDIVIQVGVGIGGGAGFPGIPGGGKLQRTYTFMATCTKKKCPCCHPWYDPRQYLGSSAGVLYLPGAAGNCARELAEKLVDWVESLF
jgi:RHS repeat-associated protein